MTQDIANFPKERPVSGAEVRSYVESLTFLESRGIAERMEGLRERLRIQGSENNRDRFIDAACDELFLHWDEYMGTRKSNWMDADSIMAQLEKLAPAIGETHWRNVFQKAAEHRKPEDLFPHLKPQFIR